MSNCAKCALYREYAELVSKVVRRLVDDLFEVEGRLESGTLVVRLDTAEERADCGRMADLAKVLAL